MGSAEGPDVKPHLPMAENDKKSIKSILKKPFQVLFQKDKKKEKKQVIVEEQKPAAIKSPPKVTPVSVLLENFQKLQIDKKKEEDEEDEFKNFSFKVVEEENDRTQVRADSHSSKDSGFSEKSTTEADSEDEKEKQLIDALKDLTVETKDEKEKKKRKIQTVFVSRGPIRNKVGDHGASSHPYNAGHQTTAENVYRQINQINRQTFSGGQVLTKCTPTDYLSEINYVLNQVEKNVQNSAQNSVQEQESNWQVAMEFLEKSTEPKNILHDFPQTQLTQDFSVVNSYQPSLPEPNPIEEFSNANHAAYDEFTELGFTSITDYVEEDNTSRIDKTSIFPTPPRSENIPSPMSDTAYNQSHSEYTLSPELSSPLSNSDNEKYQDIAPFEMSQQDYPSCVTDMEGDTFDRSRKERTSTSSMTMKQYKDMQKDISSSFSKKECCQISRKTCKQIFLEHMEKLKMEDRRDLCVKVAGLDLKTAYGVLHHILRSLSTSEKEEDLQLALFNLICERVLAQKPSLFVSDFGLNLIKLSALRCYRRPLLTRYLVQCVRKALRSNDLPHGTEHVFHEVDALGDNLVIACVRAGDVCADALSELVRKEASEIPLFDIHHVNTEGYTALHVACSLHSAESPKVHILHVLLQHGDADVWKGDVKGGDTSLHLAINSPTCDLRLVMIIFRHIDRKLWKRLAHAHNRSSVTPLEYARSAVKSTTRQNYPHEVLEFLKKCR
ncbi:unnamed protein product [Parnassius apollo]|uniref:(apollo) hypothetical protein n=1 Tax=Parnassius apollo TaxID=110799 RepID=A0A8S3Y6M4_PARAO|nr:unnamed protein product [Parnassius apollo]